MLALIACGGDDADPAPGRWQARGRFVRDPEGRAAILRGVNLSGRHKQPPYLDYHQPADYARLSAEWGMDTVRFLVLWAAIEPAEGVYDDAYLDEVATRMEWAAAAGLTVIVDMHQDLYGEGFGGDGAPRWTCDAAHYDAFEPIDPWFLNYQNEHVIACVDGFWQSPALQDHYVEAWRRLAARLREAPAVIGFDPMNEPHWGSASVWDFEGERLMPLYRDVIAAVRSERPDWIAFLEPSSIRNTGIGTQLAPFDVGDAVYAPHAYDAGAEQGDGFDEARRAAFLDNLAALAGEAELLGAPLWLGEYGGVAADPGIAGYMDAVYDGAGAAAAGGAYWHYGRDAGYGLLDAGGAEKPALMGTLVRPAPRRVAGDPISWSFDEASRRFELTIDPDPAILAPTEIAIPDRSYPDGFAVDCGGCAVERAPGLIRLGGAPARVIVTPE